VQNTTGDIVMTFRCVDRQVIFLSGED